LFFADIPIFFLPIFLLWTWIYYTYKKNIFSPATERYLENREGEYIENIEKRYIKKEKLLYIFYSIALWLLISLIIQQIIHVDRPEEAIKWVWKLLLNHIPDASFPSDHATISVSFLTSLFLVGYKKTWLIYTFFVVTMLLSRVILWVHWPFDIIVWTLVWIFASFITFKYIYNIVFIKNFNQFIIKMMKYIKL
jgi:membrane-associated phospholipid phosphatase